MARNSLPDNSTKRFDLFMISQSFKRCRYDSCVYVRKGKYGSLVYLLVYVDDMLIAAKNKEGI